MPAPTGSDPAGTPPAAQPATAAGHASAASPAGSAHLCVCGQHITEDRDGLLRHIGSGSRSCGGVRNRGYARPRWETT